MCIAKIKFAISPSLIWTRQCQGEEEQCHLLCVISFPLEQLERCPNTLLAGIMSCSYFQTDPQQGEQNGSAWS